MQSDMTRVDADILAAISDTSLAAGRQRGRQKKGPKTVKVTDVDEAAAQSLYFGREPVDEPEFVAVEAWTLGHDAAEKPSTAERSRKSKKVPKPAPGRQFNRKHFDPSFGLKNGLRFHFDSDS